MSDRPVRETNRPMSQGGPPDTSVTTVRLIGHDNALSRRLGWRFADLGMSVIATRFSEIDPDHFRFDDLRDDFVIVDLGWSGTETDLGLAVLFRIVPPEATSARVCRVIVLAPWFDPATRPAWAELGVWLVVDRATPPPEIAGAVQRLLAESHDKANRSA